MRGRLTRQDPAVDVRAGRLWQRVVRVSPVEPRGDARRPHQRVVVGRGRGEPRDRLPVRRGTRHRVHVGGDLRIGLKAGHLLEVAARDLVHVDGKVERGEPGEARGEVIDRVVPHRP